MSKLSLYYIFLCLIIMTGISCTKIDNYPGPSSTIQGKVFDALTDSTVQTEYGGGGTRVKLLETSYSSNPTPEYFQCMQDGSFHDDKIFAATYNVSVEGAFVPVIQTDDTGKVLIDSSKNIVLKSSATVNFWVQPFLRVEWVSQPVFNPDSTVTVKIRVTRGTDNPAYQGNVTDINLYVSNTANDGNNNYDPRYSNLHSYGGSSGSSLLGQVITITTTGGALPPQDIYFRVGARIASGLKRYNYNDAVSIKYP